jgi:hypothetical protein
LLIFPDDFGDFLHLGFRVDNDGTQENAAVALHDIKLDCAVKNITEFKSFDRSKP